MLKTKMFKCVYRQRFATGQKLHAASRKPMCPSWYFQYLASVGVKCGRAPNAVHGPDTRPASTSTRRRFSPSTMLQDSLLAVQVRASGVEM